MESPQFHQSRESRLGVILLALITPLAIGLALFSLGARPALAVPSDFEHGDVFVTTGDGLVKRYGQDGTELQTLDTTSPSLKNGGLCWDLDGNLYVTDLDLPDMSKFDNTGALVSHPWGGPFSFRSSVCTPDNAGHVFVGEGEGDNYLRQFSADGTLVQTYTLSLLADGISGLDLAADECTLYYTSRRGTVHRYDICTEAQLADFASALSSNCHQVKIDDDSSDVFVACEEEIVRLDLTGTVVQTYTMDTPQSYFALDLDPDGTSFWVVGLLTGTVGEIDIATGATLTTFETNPTAAQVKGLAVYDPETVEPTPTPTEAPNSVNVTAIGGQGSGALAGLWLALAALALFGLLAGLMLNRKLR